MEKEYDSVCDKDVYTTKHFFDDETTEKLSYNFTILLSEFLFKKIGYEANILKEFSKHKSVNLMTENEMYQVYELSEKIAYEEIGSYVEELAQLGYPKAIALHLMVNDKDTRNEKIVELAKSYEQKKTKTPEEYEAIAALHAFDDVPTLFGYMPAKKVGLYALYQFYQTKFWNESKLKLYDDRIKINYRPAFVRSDFAKAMAKAQLGYYAKIFRTQYCYLFGSYFYVNSGLSTALVPDEVLANFSEGYAFNNRELARLLYLNFGKSVDKNTCLEDKFSYALALLYTTGREGQQRKGIKLLRNIANEPMYLFEEIKEHMKPKDNTSSYKKSDNHNDTKSETKNETSKVKDFKEKDREKK